MIDDRKPKLNLPKHHPASRDELREYAADYTIIEERRKRDYLGKNACWLCPKSFQSLDDLKSHLKKIHGVSP